MSVLHAYPRARLYIHGANVTADLQRISPTRNDDSKQPGTLQITLTSPNDRYVITEADVLRFSIQLGLTPSEIDEVVTAAAFARAGIRDNLREQLSATLSSDLGIEPTLAAIEENQAEARAVGKAYYEAGAVERRRADVLSRNFTSLTDIIRGRIAAEVPDPLKRKILLSKLGVTQAVVQPPVLAAGSLEQRLAQADRETYLELTGQALRYPFYMGGTVFHPGDPVTCFFRDALDPSTWHFGFRGKVASRSVEVGTDLDRRITVTAQCGLRDLFYARVATNPSILDVDEVSDAEDFVVRTFAAESFRDLTLEEYLFTMLFGPAAVGSTPRLRVADADRARLDAPERKAIERRNADGVTFTQEVPRFGVGAYDLDRSRVVVFGPSPEDASGGAAGRARLPIFQDIELRLEGDGALQAYQALVDTVVRFSDVEDMRLAGAPPAPALQTIVQVMDEIGTNPQYYPVDGGRVILLAPASLGPDTNTDVLSRDLVSAIPTSTTFRSRLEMLYQVTDRLEFRVHTSPKGDLLIEMPLCDFSPDDFGVFAERYRLRPIETIGASTTENDDRVRTQLRGKYNLIPNWALGVSSDIGKPVVETLRGLVPMYGVRLEESDPPIWLGTEEAARLYAQIRLNLINADAITSQLDHFPNVAWTANRPIEWLAGGRVMTTRSVSFTLDQTGNGSYSASTTFNYTRVWDGRTTTEGRRLYSALGGVPGKPFDYAALFARRKPKQTGAAQ